MVLDEIPKIKEQLELEYWIVLFIRLSLSLSSSIIALKDTLPAK